MKKGKIFTGVLLCVYLMLVLVLVPSAVFGQTEKELIAEYTKVGEKIIDNCEKGWAKDYKQMWKELDGYAKSRPSDSSETLTIIFVNHYLYLKFDDLTRDLKAPAGIIQARREFVNQYLGLRNQWLAMYSISGDNSVGPVLGNLTAYYNKISK